MSYNIITIQAFDRQVKRLIKKYPSLKKEFIELLSELQKNPQYGTPLGNNCYKIRLAISSKGKGKSGGGGGRVITNFYIQENTIILLAIYDKSEQGNITDQQILKLLEGIR